MPSLFDPLKVGDLLLPNRIIMAPLTRSRAGVSRMPNRLMAEYYAQRASAGLILSEATVVTSMGIGYADTPGIWSPDQVAGWNKSRRRSTPRAAACSCSSGTSAGSRIPPSSTEICPSPRALRAGGNVSLLTPGHPVRDAASARA